MKINKQLTKEMGLICSLLLIFTLSVSCQEKNKIRFHLDKQSFERNLILGYKTEASVSDVYPDTLIKLKDGITLFKIDRIKSDIGVGLFFLSRSNQVLEFATDEWSFSLDIYLVDIDKDGIDEVLTLWSDESVFYIKVYGQKGGIKMCYKTNDIGNPDLWDGNKIQINKDDVLIFYQEDDATHVKSKLVFNRQSNKFELKSIEQINPK